MTATPNKCKQCGHKWYQRTPNPTRQCPKCWSFKWNKPKEKK